MTLLQTIKKALYSKDPLTDRITDILKKKDRMMLDKLASLFSEQPIQNVSQILMSVNNFSQFIEQKLQGDTEKFNEAIELIKVIFDTHKK